MKAEEVFVGILRMEGTNCEQEMYESFLRAGATPEMVHIKQLEGRVSSPEDRRSLEDYHILMIPGGFSAGDYIRAGAIFAARLKASLGEDLRKFVEEGRLIGGVCNGFQILVELGLLPGIGDIMTSRPQAALITNDSGLFECRPTLVKHTGGGKSAFTHLIPPGEVLQIPVAHAEGKFVVESESILDEMLQNDQVVFRYVNREGSYAGYPWNPNGSVLNIAGIVNPTGNVFGMMPHPERVYYRYNHATWPREGLPREEGDGAAIFRSAVEYVRKRF